MQGSLLTSLCAKDKVNVQESLHGKEDQLVTVMLPNTSFVLVLLEHRNSSKQKEYVLVPNWEDGFAPGAERLKAQNFRSHHRFPKAVPFRTSDKKQRNVNMMKCKRQGSISDEQSQSTQLCSLKGCTLLSYGHRV